MRKTGLGPVTGGCAAASSRHRPITGRVSAGAGAAVFSFVYTWIRFDYGALAPGLLVVMFVLRCLSGALLGGFAGHLVVRALYRTGVLSGLKIDHDMRTARA